MNLWKESEDYKSNIHKRWQTIGETMWAAKETALKKIFGTFNSSDDSGMLAELIIVLTKIERKPNLNFNVKSKASNLISSLKNETILIAHMYMKIFQITGPLSRCLQPSKLDLLKCQQMVTSALENHKQIQRGILEVKTICHKYISDVNNEITTMTDRFDLTVEKIQTKI